MRLGPGFFGGPSGAMEPTPFAFANGLSIAAGARRSGAWGTTGDGLRAVFSAEALQAVSEWIDAIEALADLPGPAYRAH